MAAESELKNGKYGKFLVDAESLSCPLHLAGGKARNLWLLGQNEDCCVPPWFCLTTASFAAFVEENSLQACLRKVDPHDLKASAHTIQHTICNVASIPTLLEEAIAARLATPTFEERFVAVRSSGADEDSSSHSFAGQFETYLFQRGLEQVLHALRQCWASCFSERVLSHRAELGMPLVGLSMAVVVQVMVNSEVSGVGFSRHPLLPVSSDCVLVEAVYGLGEGLVSGQLEADRYLVSRKDFRVKKELAEKTERLVQCEGGGVKSEEVTGERVKEAALSDQAAVQIAKTLLTLEESLGKPQDFEWGMEEGKLYCLQTRPIVTLPPSPFFSPGVLGSPATLWDNSNIVESFSGVTSPLTFSFASLAYKEVYSQTLKAAGVPAHVVSDYEPYLGNMVGLIRGNLYYNLMNWYRCLSCIPLGDTTKYMETMMGVKQTLDPELEAELGRIRDTAPQYGPLTKFKVICGIVYRVMFINSLVQQFTVRFHSYYEEAVATDFSSLSLSAQLDYVKYLFKEVWGHWETPIMNDTYVMLFFGLLKSLVSKWLTTADPNKVKSLQNDLLCGQGDVESTEPTKMLMRIAEYVDTCGGEGACAGLREWFLSNKDDVLSLLASEKERQKLSLGGGRQWTPESSGLRQRRKTHSVEETSGKEDTNQSVDSLDQGKLNVVQSLQRFLNKYGFRCINEQKLEENSLHDDPGFVVDMVCGYVRTKSYSISAMERREQEIRIGAEATVQDSLPFYKRMVFNWVLYHARRAVRHRENMRFCRSKLFGVYRELFRAIGCNLVHLGLLQDKQDVFYLTMEELFAFADGRSVTNNLSDLAKIRKNEFEGYRKGLSPPERFMTTGVVGAYLPFPSILEDLNLLKQLELESSADPNVLVGTPCCPGVVEGTVRVVSSIDQTEGLDGEILVTARTDPGWVPLYPLCSGLVIERGSLLSHSAVVARELGLPTIVGVSGGLMKRLKTGMKVHVDAGKGRLTIQND